jgi:folate-dependent tRNA-U54 methylase TrmFO/GidA
VSHADPRTYQPTNITFGIMPAPEPSPGQRKLKKIDRKAVTSERALVRLEEWLGERAAPILP